MTYPGMAYVFVVGVGLAAILYYMFTDSNNSQQHNAHETNGSDSFSEMPNSWTTSNNRPRQRRRRRFNPTNDCTICLTEIAVQHISIQSCGHSFHKKCIQDWQQRGAMVTPTCPNCRRKIDKVY